MKTIALIGTLALASSVVAWSQETQEGYAEARASITRQLNESIQELAGLRARIAEEQIPLNRQLHELQSELIDRRAELKTINRDIATLSYRIATQQKENKARQEEVSYYGSQLSQLTDNLETRFHISEIRRYEEVLTAAKEAPENAAWSPAQILDAQSGVVGTALARLESALGAEDFLGRAVDEDGVVHQGKFLAVGPAVLFLSDNGNEVGFVEERIGQPEPAVRRFKDPAHAEAAKELLQGRTGFFPLDPTLGDASKLEETQKTWLDEVRAGGPVMVPIFAMAGLALLVALWKWITLSLVRTPSKRKIRTLLQHVGKHERDEAMQVAQTIGGPVGGMLVTGVEHMHEPRELIEEVMYEKVLTAKLKLQGLLPFIAICAASAPLLGLLGTVTGIIQTFELITLFGSGDVKTLSGGISEALITTKFGLIVAIPSLLLHAFLSRKARNITGTMERCAVSFSNEVGVHPMQQRMIPRRGPVEMDANHQELVRAEVSKILAELLGTDRNGAVPAASVAAAAEGSSGSNPAPAN